MKRVRIVLATLIAVILATACQGDEPPDRQQELQQARQRLQRAQSKVEDLKKSRRDLARDRKQSSARAAELEALLRQLAAQETTCPIESVPRKRPDVRAVAFAYGNSPVFVGLGTGDGIILYTLDSQQHEGWYYYKTLWAVAPQYTGKVVISGEQIGGPNKLRFNEGFPGKKQLKLRFGPNNSKDWRYGPSNTLIRAAGCYALRVKGDDFNQTIVFMAIG
jgi:hypothetical protein